jgi:hypothetical protein
MGQVGEERVGFPAGKEDERDGVAGGSTLPVVEHHEAVGPRGAHDLMGALGGDGTD